MLYSGRRYRSDDRIKTLVMAAAVLVSLLAVVIATAGYGPRDDVSVHLHHTRHLVSATVDDPAPTTRAGVEGATTALFTWAAVTAAASIAVAGTEAVYRRVRAIRWRDAVDNLIAPDAGESGRL